MVFATLSILASAAAAADRPATVRRLLFDLCPRIIAGEVDLGDPAQLGAQGLRPGTGSLGWIQAETGRGKRRITVSFKDFTDKRVCKVGFGGKDNQALFRSIVEAGEAKGWRAGPGASELGGLVSFLYAPEPSTDMVMFTHWDEFDGMKPATNAGLIVKTKK